MENRTMKLLSLLTLPLLLGSLLAASPPAPAGPRGPRGPRIVVLGTAQDGGMPQTGCDCSHCAAARKNPSFARHVASLAIHIPSTGHVYLVDATPARRSTASSSPTPTSATISASRTSASRA
jgi:hypothetical protein